MYPSVAKPAAKVTACCSAIPTSNIRSGNFFSKISIPVPDGIAPVIPTIFVSCAACLTNVSANIFVYEGALDLLFTCSPVATLNLVTP